MSGILSLLATAGGIVGNNAYVESDSSYLDGTWVVKYVTYNPGENATVSLTFTPGGSIVVDGSLQYGGLPAFWYGGGYQNRYYIRFTQITAVDNTLSNGGYTYSGSTAWLRLTESRACSLFAYTNVGTGLVQVFTRVEIADDPYGTNILVSVDVNLYVEFN